MIVKAEVVEELCWSHLHAHHRLALRKSDWTMESRQRSPINARLNQHYRHGADLAVLPHCWDERTLAPTSVTAQFGPEGKFACSMLHGLGSHNAGLKSWIRETGSGGPHEVRPPPQPSPITITG